MKAIIKASAMLFCVLISAALFAQEGYEMKEGETIVIDENGKVVGKNISVDKTSKINSGLTEMRYKPKDLPYYEDGSLKIPGYIYQGKPEVDAQNYKKAKHLLYQNNPAEYERIFGSKKQDNKIIVSEEEFEKLPEVKQNYITSHPEKYQIVNFRESNECK